MNEATLNILNILTPFEITSGIAQVPAISDKLFAGKVGLNLDSGESIDSASMASGDLNLDIRNNTNLVASVQITIPNLTLSGLPFTQTHQVNGSQVLTITEDLSGYVMSPDADSVDIEIVASIPGSGDSLVAFDEADNIVINTDISNLSFNSISGVFNNNTTTITESISDLNVPDGFDDIGFVDAILTLEIENGIDLPGSISLLLSADNGKSLVLSGNIDARGLEVRSLSTITNNDVGDFLTPLPGSFDIAGSITFGDTQAHTINSGDSVFARVNIRAPFYVKVNNAEVTDLDIEKTDIDQASIEIITDHFIQGRFVYDITNHLPLGVTAIIHLSGDSASLFTTPQLSLDTIAIAGAPVSAITGITTGEIVNSGEIYLDSVDIQVLNNDSLFIRQEIYLNGSDTSGVQVTGSDYITITGRIEIEYLFDGEF